MRGLSGREKNTYFFAFKIAYKIDKRRGEINQVGADINV